MPARDPARAKALLREAGFPNGVKLRMSVPKHHRIHQAAEIIQAMAAEAGITLELQVIEVATLLRQWTSGEFESLIIAWSGRTDIDGNLWGFNACGEALNGGNTVPRPPMRRCAAAAPPPTCRRGRPPMRGDAAAAGPTGPYIYLWHPRLFLGAGAKVQGLRAVPDGLIRLQGLRLAG